MIDLSMNEVTTIRWSLEEDIENYRRAGYRSIGLWRHKLSETNEEQAVDLLVESGLRVTSLACAGGFTGYGGATFREGIDDAMSALRLAAQVQAGCLVVHPGRRNNHTSRHAMRLLRTALDELLPTAEFYEVPLVLEPMHVACAASWTFLTDFEDVGNLVWEYDTPYLRLALDTYHHPLGESERGILPEIAPLLGIVHLADRREPPSIDHERCPLGEGQLPLGDVIATLIESGYDGPFDVRIMGSEIQPADYRRLLTQSRSAFSQFVQSATSRSLASS
jgi:sugar phosphate isomerase/epimerase